MTRSSIVLGLLLAVTSAGTLLPAGAAPAVDVPSCHGLAATIVGAPGNGVVIGTEGPDVIVSNGVQGVAARGGDDLICTTGTPPSADIWNVGVFVDAGEGDDLVDTSGDTGSTTAARLHGGTDIYIGGDHPDRVHVDGDGFADSVSTQAGPDIVYLADNAGLDVLDLGGGRDSVTTEGTVSPTTVLQGGPGRDQLTASFARTRNWVFDNEAGQARRAGVVRQAWSSFERFDLSQGFWSKTATRFLGSDNAEAVVMGGTTAGARLGGGDDRLVIVRPAPAVPSTALRGGPGRDTVTLGSDSLLPLAVAHLDLQARHLSATYDNRGLQMGMVGFERHVAAARSVTITGSSADDDLGWAGCRVWVRGGRGDDRIGWARAHDVAPDRCPNVEHRIVVRGAAGDDLLAGSRYADTLDGGAGRDVARAGHGQDRCGAEVRQSCELPLG